MTTGFDKMSVNHELLLSLPFREGSGAVTQDYAKPLREVDLINGPTWTNIASSLPVMAFDGVDQYLECPGVETADLDLIGDYSLLAWVNWQDTTQSEIVVGRYETEVDGWDIYLTSTHIDTLSQRHHHVSLGGAQLTDNCFSVGWTPDTGNWYLIGVTRSGLYPQHYRNGVPLTMSYSAFGFRDPDSSSQDLVIGTRGVTKANNFYKGEMQGVRVLGRALSARDHMNIYQLEKHWFN